MSDGMHFLDASFKSDHAIMSKLQIEALKFVYSSCCFTMPELVLSDQLTPDSNVFRINLFPPTKFQTLKTPDHLEFGKMTKNRFLVGRGLEFSSCIFLSY